MKRKIVVIAIILVLVMLALFFKSNNKILKVRLDTNLDSVQVGDEIILTIQTSKVVDTASFFINYDSNTFELKESKTEVLSIAEKEGKIACIYADLNGTGVDEFQISFKAINKGKEAKFYIEDIKCGIAGDVATYTNSGSEINKVRIKVAK